MTRILRNLLLIAAAQLSHAIPTSGPSAATVRLDNATITGKNLGVVNKFYGIPYALSPTGDRRLRLPQTIPAYTTDFAATDYGLSCPQQEGASPNPYQPAGVIYLTIPKSTAKLAQGEDCLNLNVVAPSNVKPGAKLPVVVWIYGGGFQSGTSSSYDGSAVVNRSIVLNEPVIFVSMNYRLSALGFMGSKEVKAAGVGNLGLQDQRQAFRWIQKYISAFGGDPSKVTIWGESAGAISIGHHLVANNGNNEGLFHAAVMQSGSQTALSDITHGQKYYDFMVSQTGCGNATDTLDCLRGVPYDSFKAAMDKSPGIFDYQSVNLPWCPRADGVFITDTPQKLVREGKVANVPLITGDCDDEGTLFAVSNLNVTTDAQVKSYFKQNWWTDASSAALDGLLFHYPSDARLGSPYDTGFLNAITPQFKRIASIIGDASFQGPRRFFLQHRSQKQNTWSFLSKRAKSNPILGSVHASDIPNAYGAELRDYIINFATKLDPNGKDGNGKPLVQWPKYSNWAPSMLTFLDGPVPVTITKDDFRKDAINYMMDFEQHNLVN
ncbi:carotenoid ester lipase precursor [Pluteus cervinus]|uniref:Carotenoid ester lipase n=1 Tax=Pluteus cervinus TaxID=181527 RepID=A0ACD3AXW6_9AGAR|nr:carotenoid ester lipase precursor [Pluteus cervinus]